MNYKSNYLNTSTIIYPPRLKYFKNILMLTLEEKNQIATDTNDSCLRLFEYYTHKNNYKHFNPLDYESIGKNLNWTASKTRKCKEMLSKAGYLYVKKDTLPDSTKIYRLFLGKEIVSLYLETKVLPKSKEEIIYDQQDLKQFKHENRVS